MTGPSRAKTRIVILILGCCAMVALAGAALYAELQKGHYEAGTLGHLSQPAPHESVPDAQHGVIAYPLYPPQLAEGEGQAEAAGYCSMCHSTRYITMQPPLPPATWKAEVTKMKKTFGATIPDEATAKIIQYLQTHYTPETRKH
jgi:mono/diheme cytochrome c family protein